MRAAARTFEDKPAVREQVPLLVGVSGPSSSGKTFSLLRLATGIQRIVGGDIHFIDTEAKRALHYADRFKFRHIDFRAPFGPLDYLAAYEQSIAKGAKIIITDSMTHEHSGVGGVMDQVDEWLDQKCDDNENERKKKFMLAMVKPKQQRKLLNSRIVQLGAHMLFGYRALDKVKPVTGGEPEKLGWQPETTSPLFYEMTARFLLPPGSDGHPVVNPVNNAERLSVKNPEQFRGWFRPGMQLSEELGMQLATWAAGGASAPDRHEMVSRYEQCRTKEAFDALERERKIVWPSLGSDTKAAVKAAVDACKAALAEATATEEK